MAKCDICGEGAGWFRARHEACLAKQRAGYPRLLAAVEEAARGRAVGAGIEARLKELAASHFQSTHRLREAIVVGWKNVFVGHVRGAPLSPTEADALLSLRDVLQLRDDELRRVDVLAPFKRVEPELRSLAAEAAAAREAAD